MGKAIVTLICFCLSLFAQAQDATRILDKSAAALKAAGSMKIDFVLDVGGGENSGYIKLQGRKFVWNMGGSTVWFDGKTMWTYVKSNDEVNVTTPSANAVAKMNPYSFLSFYKDGYTTQMGKSSAKEHEVVLTGKKAGAYKRVVLRIDKHTDLPSSITMVTQKDETTRIRCKSIAKNQKYNESTFRFNSKYYPTAEVVDLR